jgi:MFS family permease
MLPLRILVPLIVACALFMENLDATVLSTAIPAIAHDLHQSPIQLKLALTSYLLTLAVFIPASGWVADRFGTRIVFRLAIIIFALGSALCGFAGSIQALVTARALQGIGGAMMVPVGRLVILRTIPRSEFRGGACLAYDTGADGTGDRSTGRRLYHDLFHLALDFLDQFADGCTWDNARYAVHPERSR